MLVLKGLVGLYKTVQLQSLQRYWLGHSLDNCDIEWFALEMNRDHSVIFETASKYCISDSFVDHDGYSQVLLVHLGMGGNDITFQVSPPHSS